MLPCFLCLQYHPPMISRFGPTCVSLVLVVGVGAQIQVYRMNRYFQTLDICFNKRMVLTGRFCWWFCHGNWQRLLQTRDPLRAGSWDSVITGLTLRISHKVSLCRLPHLWEMDISSLIGKKLVAKSHTIGLRWFTRACAQVSAS